METEESLNETEFEIIERKETDIEQTDNSVHTMVDASDEVKSDTSKKELPAYYNPEVEEELRKFKEEIEEKF